MNQIVENEPDAAAIALLREAYQLFNARDIEPLLAIMDPDVDWPNGMEGGRVLGHQAVREYWTRQFRAIDARVEPVRFRREADGRIAIDVHQVVRDLSGTLLADVTLVHVYRLRDGIIAGMDIR